MNFFKRNTFEVISILFFLIVIGFIAPPMISEKSTIVSILGVIAMVASLFGVFDFSKDIYKKEMK